MIFNPYQPSPTTVAATNRKPCEAVIAEWFSDVPMLFVIVEARNRAFRRLTVNVNVVKNAPAKAFNLWITVRLAA